MQTETTKTCNYRNTRYNEQIYKWVAGRGCLLYTPDFLYEAGFNSINLTAACLYEGMFAPCLEIEVSNAVRDAIVPAAHGRWERCFYTASDCCSHHMYANETEVSNAVRDAIVPAAHGRWERCFYTASDCCSHHMYANETEVSNAVRDAIVPAAHGRWERCFYTASDCCSHHISKQCYANSTWEQQTDYSTCSITTRLLRRYRFHIAVLSFSSAFCLPAVFIFFFYKRLRVTRVALHRNLLIAIILRNILVIVSRSETAMSTHSIACRMLAITERLAANMVFVAMLVEGVYLHRMIVAVFRTKLDVKWLYGIGVVIALIPVAVWSIVMGIQNDHSCWIVYTVDNIQWTLDAPRIAILLVNTALFLDVLRVLLTKLRNSENTNQLSTTKATLFLMPIFGTQFLLTAFRPSTTDCTGEQIYYYVSYTVEGLQGVLVALLYCYINKEVRALIKQTYRKTENAMVSRIRNDSINPTAQSDRRLTCSTALPSHNEEDNKNQYETMKTRLHVAEIISIQASERLAEILEPVYETIQNGIVNVGYDCLDRSENDSGFVPNRDSKDDDYYAFTNESSISIECQDWIRCVSSPSSSVYNNSLNDYETRYLERKFPNHPKLNEINETQEKKMNKDSIVENGKASEHDELSGNIDNTQDVAAELETVEGSDLDSDMIDEIMQYIGNGDNKDVLMLDPELLCPNRKEDDKNCVLCWGVESFPDGAPIDTCVRDRPNQPNHSQHRTQSLSSLPYRVLASGTSYAPNTPITVTIEGSEPFKGFFIQARSADTNQWLGAWENAPNTTIHPECASITHGDPLDKVRATLLWRAPADSHGRVYF
ncbi:Neuropeptide receptor B3, partial [Operophtera brumata]